MGQKTLKNKLIFNIFVTILISGILIATIVGHVSYVRSINSKEAELILFATDLTHKTDVFLNDAVSIINKASIKREIIDWLSAPSSGLSQITGTLEDYNIGNHYSAIYLMDTAGNTLASTEPSFIGQNYSFRNYFKDAITKDNGAEIGIGVTSEAPGLFFSKSVKNNNAETIGVIVMKMKMEALDEVLNITHYSGIGHIMLTDQNGIIIQTDRPERLFKSLGKIDERTLSEITEKKLFNGIKIEALPYDPAYALIKNGLHEVTNISFYEPEDKENEIITVSPLSSLAAFIVTENELGVIITDSLRLALIFFLLILFISILSIFGLSVFMTHLLAPFEKLKKIAYSIGQGNFQIKEEIKSGDELEDLSKILYHVSDNLKLNYQELENKVLGRTKDLLNEKKQAESAKKAIINILEDVEIEKNKAKNLASDLEKFKLALDSTSEYAIITDASDRIVYANRGMETNTGYKIKEVIGKTAYELWRLPMSEKQIQQIYTALKKDKTQYVGELKNKKKNGELFDSFVTISPLLNKNKEVEFLVSLARDITKEKEIDRAKTEFVSLASHQLRTPLSSINWYSEMLIAGDAGKLNVEQSNFVNEIYRGSQRMVELVNSLLDVSRLELGTISIEPTLVDLNEPATSIIHELQPSILKKNLTVTLKTPKKIPLLSVDPKLIRIVFQNFISNAIKYTPEKGKIVVEIVFDKLSVLIKVSDNGYGIPEHNKEKIYEKLYRADNIKEKDTEGTGLGLYIVKAIADHSGSKTWFESQENKGSTFFFSIPIEGMKKKDGTKTLNS